MKKQKLVIFTENGARIIKDPKMIEELKYSNPSILNPENLPTNGSPSFWKKNGQNIQLHDEKEIKKIIKKLHGNQKTSIKTNSRMLKMLLITSFIINVCLIIKVVI